jgi:hypothetical protein
MQSALPEAFSKIADVPTEIAANIGEAEDANPAPLSGSKRRAETEIENDVPEAAMKDKKVCTSSGAEVSSFCVDSTSTADVETACKPVEASIVTTEPVVEDVSADAVEPEVISVVTVEAASELFEDVASLLMLL